MNALYGVTFNDLNSYDDLFLILQHKTISTPEPKTEIVEVAGSNEFIDLTEFFGDVKYNRRKITMKFGTLVQMNRFMELFSTIQNALHGKEKNLYFDDDPDFYYKGRLNCSEWGIDSILGTITITADCEPFKYKIEPTVVNLNVVDHLMFNFLNLRKPVVPTIQLSSAMQVTFNTSTYALDAGTWQVPEIEFKEGDNGVIFDGTGSVSVTYQEGGL